MKNADLRETKQIIYQSKGIDESYPKMYFLLNSSHYVKRYGHLCQILAIFTMPAIWLCHMIQEANFEKMLFFPNFAFNIKKSCKISSRKALYYTPPPPPPFVLSGLNISFCRESVHYIYWCNNIYMQICMDYWTPSRLKNGGGGGV